MEVGEGQVGEVMFDMRSWRKGTRSQKVNVREGMRRLRIVNRRGESGIVTTLNALMQLKLVNGWAISGCRIETLHSLLTGASSSKQARRVSTEGQKHLTLEL